MLRKLSWKNGNALRLCYSSYEDSTSFAIIALIGENFQLVLLGLLELSQGLQTNKKSSKKYLTVVIIFI